MLIAETGTLTFFKTFIACILFQWEITGKILQLNCVFPPKVIVTGPLKTKAFPENSSAYCTFPLTVFWQQKQQQWYTCLYSLD